MTQSRGLDIIKMKLGILFSGGKDSCLAMHIAKKQGHEVCYLLSILPDNFDSFMFHKPNLELLKKQAGELGFKLVLQESSGKENLELIGLLQQGITQKDIAKRLGRDESTISKRITILKRDGIIEYPVAIVGPIAITVRGDPELKQRLEDFYAKYSESMPPSAISQMICEFVLFLEKEIKDGGELILRKNGKEQKILFPAKKLTWQFFIY
jgi:DNA-binding Lrp family transcriptional regulator